MRYPKDIPRDGDVIQSISGLRAPKPETDDGWITVGDTSDEIAPAYQGSWSGTVQFHISEDGYVKMRGGLNGASLTFPSTLFTLPVGFRPNQEMKYLCYGKFPGHLAWITVETTGDVVLQGTAVAAEFSALAGDVEGTFPTITLKPGADGFWKTVSGVISRVTTVAWSELTGIPSSFTPSAHETSHATGGSDAFTVSDLLDAVARVGIRKNSTGSTFTRRRVNLIEGSNMTITVADDSGNEEVDVTFDSSGGGGGIGATELIYRYTVTGSDKPSIDTGSDTPDAGSNDWTNGDVLEIWFYGRSDVAAATSNINVTVNNDSSALYDRDFVLGQNTTLSGGSSLADTKWQSGRLAGDTLASGTFTIFRFTLPNYRGTVAHKIGEMSALAPNQSNASSAVNLISIGYRSTSAISRIAFAADSGKNLKVGSQLLIYKRLAS